MENAESLDFTGFRMICFHRRAFRAFLSLNSFLYIIYAYIIYFLFFMNFSFIFALIALKGYESLDFTGFLSGHFSKIFALSLP